MYGGVDAENALADAAIAATEGLVLMYDGRVVSAPYHSTCGGSTAAADGDLALAQRAVPAARERPDSGHAIATTATSRRGFAGSARWRGDTLTAVVERYLRAVRAGRAPGRSATVRDVAVDGRTPSGRVAAIVVETRRGQYRVRGNDIRYVLRSPGGELLNSTYFSPEVVPARDGRLARLTIRGLGYGHGVGMCQWGAIGRARAGQDFRTILRTYFPGTSVARAY